MTATATVTATDTGDTTLAEPRAGAGPNPAELLRIAMELAASNWVLTRRLHALEALLVEHGVLAADAVERFDFSGPSAPDRAQFVRRIFGELVPTQGPGA